MASFVGDLLASLHSDLGADQKRALKILGSGNNVFVTGGAGTGKSYLLRKFLMGLDAEQFPILASTGAAAVLVGGRTFHSFFGLGIMEGGPAQTIERALKNRRVVKRLAKVKGIVIDEISMISGEALNVAEEIARLTRSGKGAWGGLRVICVGDFAQLPPVTQSGRARDWCFLSRAWEDSDFQPALLSEMMRTPSLEFAELLGDARLGLLSTRLCDFLNSRALGENEEMPEASILFPRKLEVEKYNSKKLSELEGEMVTFETEYKGGDMYQKALRQNAPIPEKLNLKREAFVMLRQNDPAGRWVNGSLGYIKSLREDEMEIKLLNGRNVCVPKSRFNMFDADGNEVASALNFPVNLAYAVTIHKAQGATLDKSVVDLRNLWEPGQAYVALSRVRNMADVHVAAWSPGSFKTDPEVEKFHLRLESAQEAQATSLASC